MSDKMKIVFAPGCFDGFEGTQDELQELIADIHRAVENGEFHSAQRLTEDEFQELMSESGEPRRLN